MKWPLPIIMLSPAIPLLAQSYFQYGFDGDLSSVFTESSLTENTFPFEQVAGRLVYHNGSQLAEDNTTILELKDIHPTKLQSWSLNMDVTIPARTRVDDPMPSAECWIMIGCYYMKGESIRFFTTEFKLTDEGELRGDRRIVASAGVDDNEPFKGQVDQKVFEESVQLKLSYFGGQITLLFSNMGAGNDSLLRVDLDPAGANLVPNILDWEMAPEDTFTLFIGAHSHNYPITPERPLQIDNVYYIQHAEDSEPGSVTIKPDLISVDVKAFPTGLSELQKSHDLENWITIRSLSRGHRETMFLPSDGGKAHYRVIGPQ